MHPKDLSIAEFTYDLPDDRVAKYPLKERDTSKLLIYKKGSITEDHYFNLDQQLPADTLLVFNNTKVVEARLLFQKSTGSTIEIFCLEPGDQYADITTAMMQKGKVLWKCLVGGAKKWKSQEHLIKSIEYNNTILALDVLQVEKKSDHFLIELQWNDASLSFAEVLHLAGAIPLPPYLNRDVEEDDKATYQTIYAKHDGSVAAPTAGLHFTENLLKKLHTKNITDAYVTLHVGAGTFKPVKAAVMQDHEMHAEFIDVSIDTIQQLHNNITGTIVAVGTTSLRTIESLYWIGVKASLNKPNLSIQQWDAYELPQDISAKDALQNLIDYMKAHNMQRLITKTQIIIAPGYTLRIAKGIITNFHQPQSTLLLLISAIVGNDWRHIYNHALQNDYRFLSYGDGCLLWGSEE
ncbi:S-adenosylmethionine:tRNA ribosyltransferase-isomerase [Chitinophagaceae bacterium LWZ2-11]